ncbi:formylglycine-generating enzyme family protein [Verrucomicrobia bacterium]|nr:formylglycine-generating enzyme family protein [Verrucomicrobiota bacterium]
MRFVPVEGTDVYFSIWETRVQDYATFAKETGHEVEEIYFPQDGIHPVAGASWDDAQAFCKWLTDKERRLGILQDDTRYGLPTDEQWSRAVGLSAEKGSTPYEREIETNKKRIYPWVGDWPPPSNAGNYAEELSVDGFEYTSPVGSFQPNKYGLFDMGGNVSEWCQDRAYDNVDDDRKVLRGNNWMGSDPEYLLSSDRFPLEPSFRIPYYGFRVVLESESLR